MFYSIHPIIIACALAAWTFGILQRINVHLMYNKKIEASDYLHAIISLGALIVPLAYFYSTGNALFFLSGFAFAYIISTLCTFCMAIILAPYLAKNTSTSKVSSLHMAFLSAPGTVAMLAVGIAVQNPFMIGAACVIASSWLGYTVTLND